MGEKGSLKYRIKDFFKIKKYLLEKKKREKQDKKQRKKQFSYYSRPKIFITKLLSCLGLCISYFFFHEKRKSLNNRNSKKKLILCSDKKESKKEIKITKKNIPFQKEKIIIKRKKEHLINIKLPQDIQIKVSKVVKEKNKESEDIFKQENKKEIVNSKEINTCKKQLKNLNKENIQEVKPLKKFASKAIIMGALGSHFIGKVSKEVIESISYNNDQKKELLFTTTPNIKEKNLESKNQKIVEKKIDSINQEQNNEENKKNDKIYPQEIRQELEPFYVRVDEIKTAHEIVQKDLLEQEFDIERIKEHLKTVTEQEGKKIKLNAIKNTASKLINFINPFHYLFKNTFISKLVHSILINHKVKKMRRILEKENKVKYYNIKKILKEIKDRKDIIQKNIYINLNTLEEINILKNDLLKEDYNILEVVEILEDLKKIEINILEKNKKLQEELEKTKELEEKGKVKIKEFKNVA